MPEQGARVTRTRTASARSGWSYGGRHWDGVLGPEEEEADDGRHGERSDQDRQEDPDLSVAPPGAARPGRGGGS